ncbi:MAG TPA: hypothetical protein VND98_02555 [Solirubrobacterales bacterium]|nr:hypothetical protein [Solirubrobacterales bacterium]
MSSSGRVIGAMLVVAVLAAAFWVLALGPKRQQGGELATKATNLKSSLVKNRQELATDLAARREFPANYGQLVVLGGAVPAESETASLLVQFDGIAARSGVRFQELQLNNSGASTPAPSPAASSPSTSEAPTSSSSSSSSSASKSGPASTASPAPAAPTEATAATLPLGATIGPAGLDVMPYTLTFNGKFLHIADFIHGLDALVRTERSSRVAVNGRLVTIDGFSLTPEKSARPVLKPSLEAVFSVTTYLTPASQGITAGATPAAPSPSTATPTSTTTGGAP